MSVSMRPNGGWKPCGNVFKTGCRRHVKLNTPEGTLCRVCQSIKEEIEHYAGAALAMRSAIRKGAL